MQGRMHDLSEGGARIITEKKNPEFGTKRRGSGKNIF